MMAFVQIIFHISLVIFITVFNWRFGNPDKVLEMFVLTGINGIVNGVAIVFVLLRNGLLPGIQTNFGITEHSWRQIQHLNIDPGDSLEIKDIKGKTIKFNIQKDGGNNLREN